MVIYALFLWNDKYYGPTIYGKGWHIKRNGGSTKQGDGLSKTSKLGVTV